MVIMLQHQWYLSRFNICVRAIESCQWNNLLANFISLLNPRSLCKESKLRLGGACFWKKQRQHLHHNLQWIYKRFYDNDQINHQISIVSWIAQYVHSQQCHTCFHLPKETRKLKSMRNCGSWRDKQLKKQTKEHNNTLPRNERYPHRQIYADILKRVKDMPTDKSVLTFLQNNNSRRIKTIHMFFFTLELEHFPASKIVNHTSKEVTSNK